jgi:oxygen-independent coproporphyrinogen-3 oxidase
LCEGLKDLGFRRYEISNWAKEGFECVHNLNYWKRKEFIGLGVSSWGFIGGVRYGNVRNINAYISKLKEGKRPISVRRELSPDDVYEEEIFLGLRLTEGIRADRLKSIPGHIEDFLEFTEGRVSIKERYMILADEIISELLCRL